MQQGIFLPESTFSADSLTVSIQPTAAGMGSAALAAAVPYLGTATQISHNGQRTTEKTGSESQATGLKNFLKNPLQLHLCH